MPSLDALFHIPNKYAVPLLLQSLLLLEQALLLNVFLFLLFSTLFPTKLFPAIASGGVSVFLLSCTCLRVQFNLSQGFGLSLLPEIQARIVFADHFDLLVPTELFLLFEHGCNLLLGRFLGFILRLRLLQSSLLRFSCAGITSVCITLSSQIQFVNFDRARKQLVNFRFHKGHFQDLFNGWAVGWVFYQHLRQQFLEIPTIDLRKRGICAFQYFLNQPLHVLGVKGMVQRSDLIKYATQTPHIRFLVVGLFLANLRRKVVRSSDGRIGAVIGMLQDPSYSEISNLDIPP